MTKYRLVPAPPKFPGRRYKKIYCQEHVLAYWQSTGDIPKRDEDIHHLDLDRTNNDPKNLAKLSHNEHAALHGRLKTKERQIELVCGFCNKPFTREAHNVLTPQRKGRTIFYCSRECGWASQRRKEYLPPKSSWPDYRNFMPL